VVVIVDGVDFVAGVVLLVDMVLVVKVEVDGIVEVLKVELDVDSGVLSSIKPVTTLAKLSVTAPDDNSTSDTISDAADAIAASVLMFF
jgi:hypothetical protein